MKKHKKVKECLNESFCNYYQIFPPSHFLPVFFNHRLEGDLLLYDHAEKNENGEIRGLLSNFNFCKHILSVSFDQNSQQTIVKLDTNENTIVTPFSMFIQRLKSQGDKNANNLSEKINKMSEFISKNKPKIMNFATGIKRRNLFYKEYQQKIEETLRNHDKELIVCFKFQFVKKSNDFEVGEITFNDNFFKKMGFLKAEEFAMNLLRKGFPDVIFIEENYHNWYSRLLTNSFMRVIDPTTPKEPMNVMVQGFRETKELHEMNLEMFNVEIDGFVEIMMMIIMKPKVLTSKKPIYMINDRKNQESLEEIEENSKEKMKNCEFLKSFYPELLIKKQKKEPVICGYRHL